MSFHRLSAREGPHSSCGSWLSAEHEERRHMAKHSHKPGPVPQQPGPGRSTAEAAFNKIRHDIAERNEAAHVEARKRRVARERVQILMRRGRDY
jgi:hypothetical protein